MSEERDAQSGSNLARLYLSGSVHRWHQNPVMAWTGQTNADHQGRCVLLLLALHPAPSVGLIRAMASHDVGELVVGDLSWLFKSAEPEFAAAHALMEDAARAALIGDDPDLTEDDARWLRLIDRLESLCWCLHRAPGEYKRNASGWRNGAEAFVTLADYLGVGDAVHNLISDLLCGDW